MHILLLFTVHPTGERRKGTPAGLRRHRAPGSSLHTSLGKQAGPHGVQDGYRGGLGPRPSLALHIGGLSVGGLSGVLGATWAGSWPYASRGVDGIVKVVAVFARDGQCSGVYELGGGDVKQRGGLGGVYVLTGGII